MKMCKLQTAETFENSLVDFLNQEEKKELDIPSEDNKISSKEEANYYIRRVKELVLNISEINDTADNEIKKQTERINKWRTNSINEYQFIMNKYTDMLRDFWIENNKNGATMKLSQGSLCMRKMKNKEEYDADAVNRFLENNCLYQYMDRVPSKAKIKEAMTINDDGSVSIPAGSHNTYILDGFKVIPQDPKFEVK